MLEPNSNTLIVEGSALDRMQFFTSEYICKLLFRKSNLEKNFYLLIYSMGKGKENYQKGPNATKIMTQIQKNPKSLGL